MLSVEGKRALAGRKALADLWVEHRNLVTIVVAASVGAINAALGIWVGLQPALAIGIGVALAATLVGFVVLVRVLTGRDVVFELWEGEAEPLEQDRQAVFRTERAASAEATRRTCARGIRAPTGSRCAWGPSAGASPGAGVAAGV